MQKKIRNTTKPGMYETCIKLSCNGWNELRDKVKQQETLNGFKNEYDDYKRKLT